MLKVEIMITDQGGKAMVRVAPKMLKDSPPTALERAAWEEMKARIFAKVKEAPKPRRRKR